MTEKEQAYLLFIFLLRTASEVGVRRVKSELTELYNEKRGAPIVYLHHLNNPRDQFENEEEEEGPDRN